MAGATGSRRAVTAETCAALARETMKRTCEDDPEHEGCEEEEDEDDPPLEVVDLCLINPEPGCPNYCLSPRGQTDRLNCLCWIEPDHPNCGGGIEICCPPPAFELTFAPAQCREFPYAGLNGIGSVDVTDISGEYNYTVKVTREVDVTISLSEESVDFNCGVTPTLPDREGPVGAESSRSPCEADDTWSGKLSAGEHTITVWPAGGGSGGHTLIVTATNVRPATTVLVEASETAIENSQEYQFYLGAEASVSVALTGMTQDFNCSVNGDDHDCTNNLGTLDDSWSGTLAIGTHIVQVEPVAGSLPGDYKLTVTAEPTPPPEEEEEEDGEDDTDGGDPDGSEPPPDTSTPPEVVSLAGSVVDQTHSLSWSAPSSSADITSYRIETRTAPTSDWSVPTGGAPSEASALPASTRSWSITVPAEAVRHYRIRASSSAGDGDWSSTVVLTAEPILSPPAPVVLKGTATSTSQQLTWSAPTSTSPITGYEMMLRESSSHNWRHTGAGSPTPSSAFPASARAWNLTNSPGLYREYRLRAKSAAGNGDWSNIVMLRSEAASSPPSAPTITGAAGVGSHSVSWTAPTSDETITRYQMAVRASSLHSWRWTNAGSPSGSSSFPPTTRSWTLSAPAGLYREYKLRATSSAGDGGWSNVVSLRALAPAPPPPPTASRPGAPSLTGTLVGRQNHTLSWTAASSTIPVTRYQMQTRNSSRHGWRYTTAGTPSPSSRFGPTVRSWRVTTPPGLHRQYRVRARNASGYGNWSNVVSLTSQGGGASGSADDDSTDDDGDGIDDGYECEEDDEDC